MAKTYMGGGAGGSYTAGTGIDITGNVISATGATTGQYNYFLFGENKTSLPNPITASVRNLSIENSGIVSINTGALNEGQNVIIKGNFLSTSITLPSLKRASGLFINGNTATSISLPLFESGVSVEISGSDATTISVPLLVNARQVNIIDNASLTSITINAGFECLSQNYSGNALTEAVVDLLLGIANDSGLQNGIFVIDGGTNAAPSVAGLASKTSLEGKGWTVTVN